ncbi:MAG: hypothetical protein Q7V88_10765 [Actinomycetota bacterium]|nr:hypothetical protein [Actinomycetota bacterium]
MATSARLPTATELNALLADWNEWVAARTDALLSLEERVRTAGAGNDEADVAAAFVARKALADRLAAVAATALRDRNAAAALAVQPITDDLGQVVGTDLADAARLLDAVLQQVEQRVAAREGAQAAAAHAAQQADADLVVAARLATALGMQVNHVAELRDRLTARRDLADVATEAATVRTSLEAADRARTALLTQWAALPDRLQRLAADEQRVRELAQRCREKVLQAPPLAVPSAAALDADVAAAGAVEGLPWVTARGRVSPVLTKADRVAAALAEAERRFRAALDRRDDLRGLLQSFADKASTRGVLEDAQLGPLYQQAKAVLWAAPCDLVAGGELVEQYMAAVNAKVAG